MSKKKARSRARLVTCKACSRDFPAAAAVEVKDSENKTVTLCPGCYAWAQEPPKVGVA